MRPAQPTQRPTTPAVLALALALALTACRRKHIPVDSVTEIPYPTCDGAPLPPGEVIASGDLRPGATSLERRVREQFEIRRRGCVYTATVRQEWPLANADVEVVYDANRLPLRAWRRSTIPFVTRSDGNADIRRYELRTPQVSIKRRTPAGQILYEILRGQRPRAVIGPGRGLLTVWIQRAHLAVGGRIREWVLDLRPELETLREVTLIREADLFVAGYDRVVRVYTVYGRESVFTDDDDVVIGDLAGLRPSAMLTTPPPPPLPLYGVPDPVNTP